MIEILVFNSYQQSQNCLDQSSSSSCRLGSVTGLNKIIKL